jgi:hypothetical protein
MSTNFDSTYLTDKQWYIPYSELQSAHNWEIIGYSSEERPLLYRTLGQWPAFHLYLGRYARQRNDGGIYHPVAH